MDNQEKSWSEVIREALGLTQDEEGNWYINGRKV